MKTAFMRKVMAGFFLLASQVAFSQADNFIASGKVLDAASKQLLSGASVFCQNTTLGTITNKEGLFSIRLPKGGYDLIISYTGYETENLHINSSNAADLVIELKTKDMSMSEVTVSGSNEVADGLAKYGKFFTDNFIGTTPNASQCLIQNPEVLQFYFSKKRNRLKIKAREDLVIMNNALGYKIKFQLDSFSHEYATGVSTYSGYPFFEELPGTEAQKNTWKQNRLGAYNGSRLHFVRSWYDSAHYAVAENEDVVIDWRGRFRVIYKNEMPDKRFLTQFKLPAYLKSQLTILDIEDEFVIEQNGYFYEQKDIINNGYWSWEKVAEALPYNYDPE
jgi:hypothetical protein